MVDWTPLIVAGGALLAALAAAVPTLVVILQHRTTRAAVQGNSEAIGRVETQTNGMLEAAHAATVSLRAEVVGHEARLARLEAAQDAHRGASSPS